MKIGKKLLAAGSCAALLAGCLALTACGGGSTQQDATADFKLINEGTSTVKVLDTTSKWFGVTYPEDRPEVVAKLAALHEQGQYPDKMF